MRGYRPYCAELVFSWLGRGATHSSLSHFGRTQAAPLPLSRLWKSPFSLLLDSAPLWEGS